MTTPTKLTREELRAQLREKLKSKKKQRAPGQPPQQNPIEVAKAAIANSSPEDLDQATQLLASQHGRRHAQCLIDLRAEVEATKLNKKSAS